MRCRCRLQSFCRDYSFHCVKTYTTSASYKCYRESDRLPARIDQLLAKEQRIASLLGICVVVLEACDLRVSSVCLKNSFTSRNVLDMTAMPIHELAVGQLQPVLIRLTDGDVGLKSFTGTSGPTTLANLWIGLLSSSSISLDVIDSHSYSKTCVMMTAHQFMSRQWDTWPVLIMMIIGHVCLKTVIGTSGPTTLANSWIGMLSSSSILLNLMMTAYQATGWPEWSGLMCQSKPSSIHNHFSA